MNTKVPVKLSSLPAIELGVDKLPSDGISIPLSSYCNKKREEKGRCERFYAELNNATASTFCTCPYGLSAFVFKVGGQKFALTGLMPFPRPADHPETVIASKHLGKEYKLPKEDIVNESRKLQILSMLFEEHLIDTLKKSTHEMRKINATIKTEAENLCRKESPKNPDNAPKELVTIWRASDLMSQQFDIIDLLGNEEIFQLKPNSMSELAGVVVKLRSIFQVTASKRGIRIETRNSSPAGGNKSVQVVSKTFAFIFSTLIENAVKNAIADSTIYIEFGVTGSAWEFKITNTANLSGVDIQRIFERGYRGPSSGGSGTGLYLAQKAAAQHNAVISINLEPVSSEHEKWSFSVNRK
jgi:signal transduction histidine kinase